MINSYGKQIAEVMSKSNRVVVLTGAGMSTASGVPCYREGNHTNTFNGKTIDEVSNTDANFQDADFIEYYRSMLDSITKGKPNKGHNILKKWYHEGIISKVLTQNIDGYHGSKGVIELHGNIHKYYCTVCGKKFDSTYYKDYAKCNSIDFSFSKGGYHTCKGSVRPEVTLFGENPMNLDAAMLEIYLADLVIVLGTSLKVSPVNLLPAMAKKNGSTVVVINRDPITSLPEEYIDYAIYEEDLVPTLQDIDYQLQCLEDKNGKTRC